MLWEHEKGCTSFCLVVGVKESHKREVPFELTLEIKVRTLAGGEGCARVLHQSKQQELKNGQEEVPGEP